MSSRLGGSGLGLVFGWHWTRLGKFPVAVSIGALVLSTVIGSVSCPARPNIAPVRSLFFEIKDCVSNSTSILDIRNNV